MYLIGEVGYIELEKDYILVDSRDGSKQKISGKQVIFNEKLNDNYIKNVVKDSKGYRIEKYPDNLRG